MSVEFPCDSCHAPMPVRRRMRGKTITCKACGVDTTIPARLDFFDAEIRGTVDRWDGSFYRQQAIVWSVLLLLPMVAFCAWTVSARLREARESGRTVAPELLSAWRWTIGCTVVVSIAWMAIANSLLR